MIVAEYFPLPVTDTSLKFLYRFKFSGTITGWVIDYIYFSQTLSSGDDFQALLKKFLLEKYRKVISEGFNSYQGEIPESSLNLLKEYEIKLVECDIAPIQHPNGYLKEIL